MCSSSKIDMAALITGPVGNLVGMGIKALVNGAVTSRNTKTVRKSKEREKIEEFYDNIEAHLKGTLRVLEPALQIKKILSVECKSADHERPVPSSSTPILYYTPQNSRKSQINYSTARCCIFKKPENRDSEKSRKPSRSYNDRSTEQVTSKWKDSSKATKCLNKCKKNTSKINCTTERSETTFKSCGTHENQGKSCGATKKSLKSKEVCSICNISLKDNSVLAVLPCNHLFCYKCLANGKCAKCQKCEKSFDMRNVTEINITF